MRQYLLLGLLLAIVLAAAGEREPGIRYSVGSRTVFVEDGWCGTIVVGDRLIIEVQGCK